jgi:hypothetical protein
MMYSKKIASLVQQKLDSVMLNKVIVEDNIWVYFSKLEINLGIILTLITNCTTEPSFSQMNRSQYYQYFIRKKN